jgi:hypothetical protein
MALDLKVSFMLISGAASLMWLAMAVSPAIARAGPGFDAAAAPAAIPPVILARSNGEGQQGHGPGGGPTHFGLSDAGTGAIVLSLQAGEMLCGQVPLEYRPDCLAQAFRLTANLAQANSEYVGAAIALNSASRDISRLVSQNADPAAPRVRSQGRTYRAVRPEAAPAVNAQVEAIITETETRLLRSTGSVGQAHYQRIAQAVGSTKRILRS